MSGWIQAAMQQNTIVDYEKQGMTKISIKKVISTEVPGIKQKKIVLLHISLSTNISIAFS